MAQEIASLFVRLGLQDREFRQGLMTASQQLKGTERSVKGVSSSLGALKTLAITAFAGWGISRMVGEMRQLMEASGRQEKAMAGVEQAMRSMGRYTPALHKELVGTAKGLQDITTFGDEAILEGQKFLLTYKQIGDDMLPRASKAMADLAALMGGDTRQAANMLGKAAMGLTGELRRVGITVERSTFEAEGFKGVLREIESQVQGQAEAMAKTGYGGFQQIGNLAGDIKEKLGDLIFLKFGDTLNSWKDALKGVNNELEEVVEREKINVLVHAYGDSLRKNKEETTGWARAVRGLASAWDEFTERRRIAAEGLTWEEVRLERLMREYYNQVEALEDFHDRSTKADDATKAHIKTMTDFAAKAKIFGDMVSGLKKYNEEYAKSEKEATERIKERISAMKDAIKVGNQMEPGFAPYSFDDIRQIEISSEIVRIKQRQERIQAEHEAQEKIREDREQQEKEAHEESLKRWNRFLERVEGHVADAFYRMFDEGLDSWDSFFDAILDMFKRMLAEMAAAWAMQQFVMPAIQTGMGALGMPVPQAILQSYGIGTGPTGYAGTAAQALTAGGGGGVGTKLGAIPGIGTALEKSWNWLFGGGGTAAAYGAVLPGVSAGQYGQMMSEAQVLEEFYGTGGATKAGLTGLQQLAGIAGLGYGAYQLSQGSPWGAATGIGSGAYLLGAGALGSLGIAAPFMIGAYLASQKEPATTKYNISSGLLEDPAKWAMFQMMFPTIAGRAGQLYSAGVPMGETVITEGTALDPGFIGVLKMAQNMWKEAGYYQHGTPYVSHTGFHYLHRGERVTPEHENRVPTITLVNQGVITTNDVDAWLAERIQNMNWTRTGQQYATVDLETIGLAI